jgi:hypothetical protein
MVTKPKSLIHHRLQSGATTTEEANAKGREAPTSRKRSGALTTELVVAMAILATALLPISFAFIQEMKLCRAYYYKAVAMEIIDGEMEILVAGEWRAFQQGTQPYAVNAGSATNLPPGKFTLTLTGKQARLEWAPNLQGKGGKVSREAKVR